MNDMDNFAFWYRRGQRNALRNIMVHVKIRHDCEKQLSNEQFDDIVNYIISQAPDSETYKELKELRDWDFEKERFV